ncbi:glucose starvation-inducible protein B [Klebsiella pneumoniae]|nr:glucose starvation-inducible protein B [Klebsiella pneumoniae]
MAEHRGGSGNFAEDREKASEAGRKGGQHSGGNFKNDPQRASEAGKKRRTKQPRRWPQVR